MHGRIIVYRSPDLNHDGLVNILYLATVAFSFGSNPNSQTWNTTAELSNDGRVDIKDVAIAAFYYSQFVYFL